MNIGLNINLIPALPEIFMTFMIIVMLLTDAFVGDGKKFINYWLTLIALIGSFSLQLYISNGQTQETFNSMFILDNLASTMKIVIYIMAIVITIYTQQYIIDKKFLKGEFYAIYLFAILGMFVMISANSLLILYVGLELLSLALYALVALERDKARATEAALKFFILGALSSGLLLYGISFIYGATGGQLQLLAIFNTINNHLGENTSMLIFGLVFIVAGVTFKLGLVPFHMWVPDVYEGSSLAVTTIIATITKIAATVFMLRFLINALSPLNLSWSIMLAILAFLSLFLGNTVAIAQTNIKRLMGYSTIANMGFVAFGLMTVTTEGISSMIFYIVTYALTALAGFGVLILLSDKDYECEQINDLKGLSKSQPVYAGILMLVMLSLAGIPPLVGFYAKFKILEALINVGYIRAAIFAVLMSLIGAFYYLRIIKIMYFDEKEIELKLSNSNYLSRILLCINGIALVGLGILPDSLLNFCVKAITGS